MMNILFNNIISGMYNTNTSKTKKLLGCITGVAQRKDHVKKPWYSHNISSSVTHFHFMSHYRSQICRHSLPQNWSNGATEIPKHLVNITWLSLIWVIACHPHSKAYKTTAVWVWHRSGQSTTFTICSDEEEGATSDTAHTQKQREVFSQTHTHTRWVTVYVCVQCREAQIA